MNFNVTLALHNYILTREKEIYGKDLDRACDKLDKAKDQDKPRRKTSRHKTKTGRSSTKNARRSLEEKRKVEERDEDSSVSNNMASLVLEKLFQIFQKMKINVIIIKI